MLFIFICGFLDIIIVWAFLSFLLQVETIFYLTNKNTKNNNLKQGIYIRYQYLVCITLSTFNLKFESFKRAKWYCKYNNIILFIFGSIYYIQVR